MFPRFPLVKALQLSFMDDPSIAFTLTGLGSVGDLGSIKSQLMRILKGKLVSVPKLPKSIFVPMVSDAAVVPPLEMLAIQ